MVRIYLIRHGQSVANRDRTVQGIMDSPLTKLGIKQAKALRPILPTKIDHIYLSPLSRAYQTGLISTRFKTEKIQFSVHDDLMEINFGELQGIKYDEVPFDRETIRKHVRFEMDVLKGRNNAETVEGFLNRTHNMFDQIVEEMKQKEWENVVVFTHGGFLRSILQHHLKLSDERFENTEIAILTLSDRGWQVERKRDHIHFD